MKDIVIYVPALGLEGTIPELVDQANKYTQDFSDVALERISELAKAYNMEERYIQIPLLLKDERRREQMSEDGVGTPYERMKIDWYIFGRVSYSASDGKGGETEIWSENENVIVSLSGVDEDGHWSANSMCSIQEFMQGEYEWLDSFMGSVYSYNKEYIA